MMMEQLNCSLVPRGQVDDISKPLKNFLDYVDGHAPADELMQEIDSEVNLTSRRYLPLARSDVVAINIFFPFQ